VPFEGVLQPKRIANFERTHLGLCLLGMAREALETSGPDSTTAIRVHDLLDFVEKCEDRGW